MGKRRSKDVLLLALRFQSRPKVWRFTSLHIPQVYETPIFTEQKIRKNKNKLIQRLLRVDFLRVFLNFLFFKLPRDLHFPPLTISLGATICDNPPSCDNLS